MNGGLLLLWSAIFLALPDFPYRLHRRWFPASRETYGVVMYIFLGAFKMLFLFFNVVPFLALLIIG